MANTRNIFIILLLLAGCTQVKVNDTPPVVPSVVVSATPVIQTPAVQQQTSNQETNTSQEQTNNQQTTTSQQVTNSGNNTVIVNIPSSVPSSLQPSPVVTVQPTVLPTATPVPSPTQSPPATVSSLTISSSSSGNPKPGDILNLTAKVKMSDNTESTDLTWAVSDSLLASVDSTGKVTFLKEGSVTVTATSTKDGSKKDSVTFTILYPSASGKIVFASNMDGKSEIYIINADGSGQKKLPTNPNEASAFSYLSQNGNKIVFSRDWDSKFSGNSGGIYTMNSDGSAITKLISFAFCGSWSYDSGKIVYTKVTSSGSTDLFVSDSKATGIIQITNTSATEFLPSYSPDGSKIVYVSNKDGKFNLYTITSEGAGEKLLFKTDASGYYLYPRWSPDGKKVFFVSNMTNSNPEGDYEIFSVTSDGANLENITNNTLSEESVDISPDGNYLVYSVSANSTMDLFISRTDGSNIKKITDCPSGKFCSGASWGK